MTTQANRNAGCETSAVGPLEGHAVCHPGGCCLRQSGEQGHLWSPLKEELALRLQGANSLRTLLQQGPILLSPRGPAITDHCQRIGPGCFCPTQSLSKGNLCSGVPSEVVETLSDVQLGQRCPLLNPPPPSLRPPTTPSPPQDSAWHCCAEVWRVSLQSCCILLLPFTRLASQ